MWTSERLAALLTRQSDAFPGCGAAPACREEWHERQPRAIPTPDASRGGTGSCAGFSAGIVSKTIKTQVFPEILSLIKFTQRPKPSIAVTKTPRSDSPRSRFSPPPASLSESGSPAALERRRRQSGCRRRRLMFPPELL